MTQKDYNEYWMNNRFFHKKLVGSFECDLTDVAIALFSEYFDPILSSKEVRDRSSQEVKYLLENVYANKNLELLKFIVKKMASVFSNHDISVITIKCIRNDFEEGYDFLVKEYKANPCINQFAVFQSVCDKGRYEFLDKLFEFMKKFNTEKMTYTFADSSSFYKGLHKLKRRSIKNKKFKKLILKMTKYIEENLDD